MHELTTVSQRLDVLRTFISVFTSFNFILLARNINNFFLFSTYFVQFFEIVKEAFFGFSLVFHKTIRLNSIQLSFFKKISLLRGLDYETHNLQEQRACDTSNTSDILKNSDRSIENCSNLDSCVIYAQLYWPCQTFIA